MIYCLPMKSHLLYVEDEPINALVLTRLLADEYVVTVAPNAQEALNALKNKEFDVLILDYNLNTKMTGLDLLNEIRAQFPTLSTPAIALTADSDLSKSLVGKGFDASLSKPYGKEDLQYLIRSCMTAV